MAATTYVGSGGVNTISNIINGVGLQPDLLWTKSRSSGAYHYIQNSVVGVNKALYSNTTDSEYTLTTTTTALNTNGFAFNGGESGLNASAATYVGWQWKAGGTAVSNTAGTITSSVSANTTAGFSVVTYTGTGANATVGHGLGVAPAMIFSKSRNNGSADAGFWDVYHVGLTSAAYFLKLNTTDAQISASTVWNSTAPASTVYSIGTASGTNAGAAATYVAYCWAPVAGYSAFGKYTGNNSVDGPFIYTGFRPRWFMIKNITVAGQWMIWDSSRDTYNPEAARLDAQDSAAEVSVSIGDFVSNGIKIRQTGTAYNATGSTYIYAAYAENPLKYANAR
jgi:hypothetical protein